ncbi:Fanconi anemia group G protein homolog [Meleagris gallopavo]|uniref:Fanconi anemia group G protein homolog n=1 Tax=Meleagris gallopavo TaxID=9103 RepID=UPI000549966F|nr:Fanconi anemia group G protein homolog [Meleagris gallopavo]XP_019465879.1 Fanconi anemia group G protein homolog [Meleagris gallopavo]
MMPLELTVLYNSLLFVMGTSDCAIKGEAEGIRQGLLRVLEACGTSGQGLSTEELWQKVVQEVTVEELQAPLHRLGALQAAWWLADSCLQSITDLFRLLSSAEDPGRAPCSGEKNELLTLLKAWRAPAEEAPISLVQSTEDLKETLCTAAAFLQGLCEGGGHPCQSLTCSFVPAHPPLTHLLLFWFLFLSMPLVGLFSSEKSLD